MSTISQGALSPEALERRPTAILHYIDGQHVPSADGRTIYVTDPVTPLQFPLPPGGPENPSRRVIFAAETGLMPLQTPSSTTSRCPAGPSSTKPMFPAALEEN